MPTNDVIVLQNARIFDGTSDGLAAGDVRIEGDRITAVGTVEPPSDGQTIDVGGRVVMPGLIDAHMHLTGMSVQMQQLYVLNPGLVYAKIYAQAKKMLLRGFTTGRDLGGDVTGVRQAIDLGLVEGPRFYPSRAFLSQTGGHGDFAFPYDATSSNGGPLSHAEEIGFAKIADGVDMVLAAAREQFRLGATQLKVMVGGGVQSFYDNLTSMQYTKAELRAAVDVATDWGSYVAVHVYTSAGVRRALEAGVLSIEHGHLADEETIKMIADHGAWLSTQPFHENDHSFPDQDRTEKNKETCKGTDQLYEWAQKHGVKTAYGTDLMFEPEHNERQIRMFPRLAQYMSPVDALRMVTSGNGELVQLAGERDPYAAAPLGVVQPGAWADVLVVDGDPTTDLSLFDDYEANLRLIMRGGRIAKNTLPTPGEG